MLPNIDMDTIPRDAVKAAKYPGTCFPMMGLHPCSVKEDLRKMLDWNGKEIEKGEFIAGLVKPELTSIGIKHSKMSKDNSS